ncbi:MAG: phosphoribosylanthranilate isomerase [Candidatus Altiarchaeota archaeon]|nr:phosphoribosylanthranilate isomerase [Candidatus Altiarchaeota archaeon]
MAKVKVCGLTRLEDALMAAELGADYLGFVVDVPVETPRKITLNQAASLASEIDRMKAIFVLMPSSVQEVERVLKLRPFGIQFHGDEPPELLKDVRDISLKTSLIKTIHVPGTATYEEVCNKAKTYDNVADYLLLDTQTELAGGTGITHDWSFAQRLGSDVGKPVFLSGGLTPENVGDAVRTARPFCADASSGLESSPGVKDPMKVRRFIREVRACSI